MRSNWAGTAVSVGMVVALLSGIPGGVAVASPRTMEDSGDSLVKGQGISQVGEGEGRAGQVVTLHGVRRVPQATVVYASSIGKKPGGPVARYFEFNAAGTTHGPMTGPCHTMIIDTRGGKVYDPLKSPTFGQLACLAKPGGDPTTNDGGKGVIAAIVLPELPADLTEVDVVVGGVEFQKVPVEDGFLMPTGDSPTLESGTWPEVEQDDIDKAAKSASDSTRELEFVVEDLKGEQGTVVGGDTTTVRLKSDILFAVDKYELTEAARKRIAEIAEDLKKSGDLSKPVKVTGHTDNVNTQAYNQTLSEKRAASVVAELKKHLPAGTQFEQVGKSFTEPIADNNTAEGRAKNRRVEIEVGNK